MHNKAFRFLTSPAVMAHPSYAGIKDALTSFTLNLEEFKQVKLENLLMPLSEIIRINPEHSHDKNIAEKIFSKIFW
jgi:hypothetical protein